MKIYYKKERGCFHEYELENADPEDLASDIELYIQEIMDDYWNNHDGWEGGWPAKFTFHSEYNDINDDHLIVEYTVNMEAVPEFFVE